jgi:hypothetical protein
MLAIASAVCVAFLGSPAPAAAQSSCSGGATFALDGGVYEFDMDEWNSSLEECATMSGTNGFTVTDANFNLSGGAPATYTSVFRGCHWGDCTSSNPFPIQESNISSASTSVSITQPGGYANDSAYDIWFNTSPTTGGQPNGTEIMIWINHQGGVSPFGSYYANVNIDGMNWNVYYGRQSSWNCISYEATSGVTSANLNLLPFFSDSISRGQLESSWYLLDVEYGFEIWKGGTGLAVDSFSVSASAGGGGGGGGGGATLNTGVAYNLVNENSGSCIDMGGTANGSVVQQWSCANGSYSTQTNQEWEFENGTAGGYYYVSNIRTPSETWNVLNNGTTSGSLIQTWTYAGNPNEEWKAVSLGNGYYNFVGQGSGLCLDTPGASKANGVQLQIYTCNGTAAQAFKLVTP